MWNSHFLLEAQELDALRSFSVERTNLVVCRGEIQMSIREPLMGKVGFWSVQEMMMICEEGSEHLKMLTYTEGNLAYIGKKLMSDILNVYETWKVWFEKKRV